MAKINEVPTPWHERNALNLVHLISDGIGDKVIKATQFFRIGQVNMGIQIQAVGCSITPSITLCNTENALSENPADQARVKWKTFPAIADGDMFMIPLAATAVKLHFSAAGEAFVISF